MLCCSLMLMLTLLLAGALMPALAAALPEADGMQDRLPMLLLQEANIETWGEVDVFSGPGEEYYRGSGEDGVVYSGDIWYAVGSVGDWMLVQYTKGEGDDYCPEMGYIDISGIPDELEVGQLSFLNIPLTAPKDCDLWSAPDESSKTVSIVKKGEPFSLLAGWADEKGNFCWAYVEAEMNGMSIRGFIRAADYGAEAWQRDIVPARFGEAPMDDSLREMYAYRYAVLKQNAVGAGAGYTVGLKADGTAVAAGSNKYGQCDVDGWSSIIAVSAGSYHTVGLRADGTVAATGSNAYGQCDVEEWNNMVAVSAGERMTVGLRADGTVEIAGDASGGRYAAREWRNIIAVSAGGYHVVGLQADGTAIAAGAEDEIDTDVPLMVGQCNVGEWRDMVSVSAGGRHTAGLKADGTAVAIGESGNDQLWVDEWEDVTEIIACGVTTVGLTKKNKLRMTEFALEDDVDLSGVVWMDADDSHIAGLRADGTVVMAMRDSYMEHEAWDVSGWEGIGLPEDAAVFRN